MQFIRIIDTLSKYHNLMWKVTGSFVHSFFTNSSYTSSSVLEMIVSSPSINYPTKGLLFALQKDLVTMNLIKNIQFSNSKLSCTAGVNCNDTITYIDVIIYLDFYPSICFNTDYIVFTSNGISTIDINDTNGIQLTRHIRSLQDKELVLVGNYFNIFDNHTIRRKNAILMRMQLHAMLKDYTIRGKYVLDIQSSGCECPVCLECQSHFVSLICSHSFCVNCLASHIEKENDSNGKCPMCRALIFLRLIDM